MRFQASEIFAAHVVPGDVEKEGGNVSLFAEYPPFARQQELRARDWQDVQAQMPASPLPTCATSVSFRRRREGRLSTVPSPE